MHNLSQTFPKEQRTLRMQQSHKDSGTRRPVKVCIIPVKSTLHNWHLALVITAGQIIQGCCNFGKAFYEVPVVTNQPNKRLHFGVSVWRQTLSNGFQVLLQWKNPFLAHMVSQIIDLGLKHIALRQLQLEAMFSEVIKDHTHSLKMLLRCLRETITSSK